MEIPELFEGLEWKRAGDQMVLKECPACHNSGWHFYSSPAGLWDCKKCGARGNLFQLKKLLGKIDPIDRPFQGKAKTLDPKPAETYHENLLSHDPSLEYLMKERGFSQAAIAHFRLGYCWDQNKAWLSIPHFRADGTLANIKFRTLPPHERAFRRVEGCESILFNESCLREFEEIILVEGELDAVSLWSNGINYATATTTGANGLSPAAYEALQAAKKIYISYDTDDAGQRGAKEAAKRLGFDRCVHVKLPKGKDANEFFQLGGTREEFEDLLRRAKGFDIENVSHVSSVIDSLLQRKISNEPSPYALPWANVQRLFDPPEAGDIVAILAHPGTGKTAFALNVAVDYAKRGLPVLFYCLEMPREKLVRRILQAEFGKGSGDLAEADFRRGKEIYGPLPLYFGYSVSQPKLDRAIETIREAVKRYDLKAVFFDNLHLLVRHESNMAQLMAAASKEFKALAMELEIPVFLVCQPKQPKTENEKPGMESIKDSSAIAADASSVIALWRNRVDGEGEDGGKYDPRTLVRLCKVRDGGTGGGQTLLYFKGEHYQFREILPEEKPRRAERGAYQDN